MSDLVKIDVSRDKMTATIKTSGVDNITREDILSALKNNGVVYGIFDDVVDISTSVRSGGIMVIAKGEPSVQGANGWVEILWENNSEQGNNENSRAVDFRETSKLVSVYEGFLLAQRHPPREGTPGKGVTGEAIMPIQPKAARLVVGRGAKLDETGDRAYSTSQGRPVAKIAGTTVSILVEPSYAIAGDVSLKTGNIRFKGDVTVAGNVTETMSVEASGSVRVNGIVTGANVHCGESLVILKNVISSNISAGLGYLECGKVKYLLQDLYSDLVKVLQIMEQLRGQSPNLEKIPFFQVVNGLIETRFKNIRVNAKQAITLKSFNLPFEVSEALEAIKIAVGISFTQEDFKDMMNKLSQALAIMNAQENNGARVEVGAVSASTIKCSGSVVSSKGCVNTTIYAGGDVKITGHFKGGEIYCEGNVEMDELGSNLGAPPLVRVKSKHMIKINKPLPGSIIQIGSNRINISRELGRSVFKLNTDSEIEIIPV